MIRHDSSKPVSPSWSKTPPERKTRKPKLVCDSSPCSLHILPLARQRGRLFVVAD